MTVDKKAVDEMARILSALNGNAGAMTENYSEPGRVPVGLDDNPAAKKDAMKVILEAMNGAVGRSIVEDTRFPVVDHPMDEAIMTETFDGGIRIGEWEIRTIEKNLYDVGRSGEPESLVRDIGLYEAAVGLVRLLNSGKAMNSPDVLALLTTERTYSESVADAIRYARLLRVRNTDPKVPVWEARYSDSKMRAAQARKSLCERVGDLG
jgi:hypothetical protein